MKQFFAVLLIMLGGVANAASTDRSGTIVLGGTAQTLMTTNPTRVGCVIQPLGVTDIWISLTGTASASLGSYDVPAGSVFICPRPTSTGVITIFSNTTGQPFTAVEITQ